MEILLADSESEVSAVSAAVSVPEFSAWADVSSSEEDSEEESEVPQEVMENIRTEDSNSIKNFLMLGSFRVYLFADFII